MSTLPRCSHERKGSCDTGLSDRKSVAGHLQTFGEHNRMSALPRKRTSESRTVISPLGHKQTIFKSRSGPRARAQDEVSSRLRSRDLRAQCFDQEGALPRARLLENLTWIIQQAEMAAIDVSPLLAATHEPKYRPRHVGIAVNHLVVATGHE